MEAEPKTEIVEAEADTVEVQEPATVELLNPSVPPVVAAAISEVMRGVRKLQFDDRNQHGGYAFASADKFFEHLGGACARAGLIITQEETETEIIPNQRKDKAPWLRVKYEFGLEHVSGAVHPKTFRRSVMVPITGGQSFGAAQSYTLKQFQRSLFQIATGENDEINLDESGGVAPGKMSATEKKKRGLWRGPLQITALRNKLADFDKAIREAGPEGAEDVIAEYAEVLDQAEIDLPEAYTGNGAEIDGALGAIRAILPEWGLESYEHIDKHGEPVAIYHDAAEYIQAVYVDGERTKTPAELIAFFEHNEDAISRATAELSPEDTAQYYTPMYDAYRNAKG